MDWLDYREELGIGFSDEEKTKYFFAKIFNVLDALESDARDYINEEEYYSFCNMTGTPMEQGPLCGREYDFVVSTLRSHKTNFKDFVAYYIAFVNCQEDNDYKHWTKQDFKNLMCNLLDQSHIPYELIEDEGSYFLFPKGAKGFDKPLVSDVLLWLKDYPLTQKAWIKALRGYSEATEETASETADNFRKALERFFQEFFESEKSLENLRSTYGEFLSDKGVPAEIRNNFEKLLDAYTSYNNNYAKHHDRVSTSVLEYIMYQTGCLIRLIITLERN